MSRVLRRMGERRRSASVFTAFPRVKGLPVEPLGINFAARGACLQCFVSDIRKPKFTNGLMALSGASLTVVPFILCLVIIENGMSVDHPILGVNDAGHSYLPKVLRTHHPTDLMLLLIMLATKLTIA